MALTAKQDRFVSEYLIDLNATQAAIRAGYSEKTAKSVGSENLTKPDIQAAISSRRKRIVEKLDITPEKVLAELAKIGFSDIRNVVSWKTVDVPIEVEEELEAQPHGGALKRSKATTVNLVEMKSSDEIDDMTAAAISEISQTDKGGLKIKFHDKKGALIELGKHLGIFKDKVEHSGNIVVEVTRFSDEK